MATTEDREQDAWSQIWTLVQQMRAAEWDPKLTIWSNGEVVSVEFRVDLFRDGQPNNYAWRFEFGEAAQQILSKLESIKQEVNRIWDSKKI